MMIFYKKYREVSDYIIFGGLTTLVNLIAFYIFDTLIGWPYLVANAIAIILSILFAYVTNKIFVFRTKELGAKENVLEFIKFIGFRGVSLLADSIYKGLCA